MVLNRRDANVGYDIRRGSVLWHGALSFAILLLCITMECFLINNLLPVTIGDILGGAVLVGAVDWFVYLRRHEKLTKVGTTSAPKAPMARSAR